METEELYNQLAEITERMVDLAKVGDRRRLYAAALLLAQVVRLLHDEQEEEAMRANGGRG